MSGCSILRAIHSFEHFCPYEYSALTKMLINEIYLMH